MGIPLWIYPEHVWMPIKRKEKSKMFQARQLGATLKTGNKINEFFSAPAGWSSFFVLTTGSTVLSVGLLLFFFFFLPSLRYREKSKQNNKLSCVDVEGRTCWFCDLMVVGGVGGLEMVCARVCPSPPCLFIRVRQMTYRQQQQQQRSSQSRRWVWKKAKSPETGGE